MFTLLPYHIQLQKFNLEIQNSNRSYWNSFQKLVAKKTICWDDSADCFMSVCWKHNTLPSPFMHRYITFRAVRSWNTQYWAIISCQSVFAADDGLRENVHTGSNRTETQLAHKLRLFFGVLHCLKCPSVLPEQRVQSVSKRHNLVMTPAVVIFTGTSHLQKKAVISLKTFSKEKDSALM